MNDQLSAKEQVAALIERARSAQKAIEGYSQEQIDELVKAIAWAACKEENARMIAELAVEETRLGNFQGKYTKLTKKVKGALWNIKDQKSVGVVERDEAKGLIKIAKPVGVVGAIAPTTNPEATPVIKSMFAIKGGNAILIAPHPRAKKTNKAVVDLMRAALRKYGAPEDLIIAIEEPSLELSAEVMDQCDMIAATGGAAMVKAAYSSGTPAYGVGAGNAVVIVDETADIQDAAHKVMLSKTFDYATSCSAENSLLIQAGIYAAMLQALKDEGGYLCNAEEKAKLQAVLWVDGHLNNRIVAQPAGVIAAAAGIALSEGCKFLMVEETGMGKDYPFSGEKLCVVLTLYQFGAFASAIDMVNTITSYQGKGHSCGIHSNDESRILELGLKTRVSRIMVRQPQCFGNTGDWVNGMPFTMTLGCGSWGGNITTENLTWKHFINTTWIANPITPFIPTDEELFGAIMI